MTRIDWRMCRGALYGWNTLGTLFGALLGGYWLKAVIAERRCQREISDSGVHLQLKTLSEQRGASGATDRARLVMGQLESFKGQAVVQRHRADILVHPVTLRTKGR